MITNFNLYTENITIFKKYDFIEKNNDVMIVLETSNDGKLKILRLGTYIRRVKFIAYEIEKPMIVDSDGFEYINTNLYIKIFDKLSDFSSFYRHFMFYVQDEEIIKNMFKKYKIMKKTEDFNL